MLDQGLDEQKQLCDCVVHLDCTLDMGAGLRHAPHYCLFCSVLITLFCSSSAAVEMAVAIALAKLYKWHEYDLSRAHTKHDQFQVRMRLARLCQKVENEFVGVPCGILDQACSAFGEQGRIVRLLCGYSPVQVSLCAVGNGGHSLKMNMWVFASGVRHELVDSPYATMPFPHCIFVTLWLGTRLARTSAKPLLQLLVLNRCQIAASVILMPTATS
jgi:hypothetical protein